MKAWYVVCPGGDGIVARYNNEEAARHHRSRMDDDVCGTEHYYEEREHSHGYPLFSTMEGWAKSIDKEYFRLYL